MNVIRLSQKEIGRAENGITIISRPQSLGGQLIAAVEINSDGITGTFLGTAYAKVVDEPGDVAAAVHDIVHWLDKRGGMGGAMADASRSWAAEKRKLGTQVIRNHLPKCDYCHEIARYDGKTKRGPWANMCVNHFSQFGIGLGINKGQELILRPE